MTRTERPAAPAARSRLRERLPSLRALFWLFLFGSVAGFLLEGLYCVIRRGRWENHSATVVGPFCIIYGIGAVAICLLCALLKGKSLLLQFPVFALTGTAIEYACSLFQQLVFGSSSWNYTGSFLSIGGRVNFRMTLIWGVLGVVLGQFLTPLLRLFDRADGRFWEICRIVLTLFLAADLLLSAATVLRWRDRVETAGHPTTQNAFVRFLDEKYGDDAMQRIYPNMTFYSGK